MSLCGFEKILEKGDPSYAVEASALRAYAGTKGKDAVSLFSPWLAKECSLWTCSPGLPSTVWSGPKTRRLSALTGNGKEGKSRVIRTTALNGLARLAPEHHGQVLRHSKWSSLYSSPAWMKKDQPPRRLAISSLVRTSVRQQEQAVPGLQQTCAESDSDVNPSRSWRKTPQRKS